MIRAAAIFPAAVAIAMAQQPASRGVNFYSKEKEAALGRSLAEELRKTTPVLDNPVALRYLEGVVKRIAARIGPEAPEFHVEIAAIDKQEPAALPGGYLFVPTGLFLSAASEFDFVTQVAHGMAHIAARHGTRQATRGEIVGMNPIPLIFIGGWSTWHGEALIPVSFRETQRKYEAEAAELAAGYVSGPGFASAPEAFAAAQAEVRAAVARVAIPRQPPTLRR